MTLVERVALAMHEAAYQRFTLDDLAEAAIREVRTAMREPGEAVLDAARPITPYPASAWALMLDAFARENGLEP